MVELVMKDNRVHALGGAGPDFCKECLFLEYLQTDNAHKCRLFHTVLICGTSGPIRPQVCRDAIVPNDICVAKKSKVQGELKVRVHEVLELAVEEGINKGWKTAYKHSDAPEESFLKECLNEAVMGSLYDYFTT